MTESPTTPSSLPALLPDDADAQALSRAAGHLQSLIVCAQKAEAFDTLAKILQDIALLEADIARGRRSRRKTGPLNEVALRAKIIELNTLALAIVDKHKPR